MKPILFYGGEWDCFSNFSSYAVEWQGVVWMTSEHAYQASKFEDESIRALIRDARSPSDAKRIAEAHGDKIRVGWHDVKLKVMEEILRAKLAQHSHIRKKLIESGDRELIEDSRRDSFWGRGSDGKGKNHLGRLWMKLRAEIV